MAGTVVIKCSKEHPPYGALLAVRLAGYDVEKTIQWADVTEVSIDGIKLTTDAAIARYVARLAPNALQLLGRNICEQSEVETWVSVAEQVSTGQVDAAKAIKMVEAQLTQKGNLAGDGKKATLADLVIWAVLSDNEKSVASSKTLQTFFDKIKNDRGLAGVHALIGKHETAAADKPTKTAPAGGKAKDEGKFVELPGAEMGKVVVRFPPEASGYLHIGHAKAALLNQYYQQAFNGQLIMRFDDTNPAKENAEFEKVILEDLKMLEVKPDRWTHTSDHFDMLLDMCERLLKEGKAFVDDTDPDTMKKEREERKNSRNRDLPVAENLALWEEMKKGSQRGCQCCVRIKMDMNSNNGCMRDPAIYRCKVENHVRTGDKYKVYPTYDFACPIVDSIEGVTHALRTTEYHDRDDQYYFICDALNLRKPHIWEYARLNMTNTVMSKRKLTWFVDEGHVEGWDDPRFPTVRGVMRRGMTVEGLKQFIVAQGGSRSVVMMEWDKIWAFNKKVIDPVAPRFTALTADKLVTVNVKGQTATESKPAALHPKDAAIGEKQVWYAPTAMIEQADAQEMQPGQTVTFINWGNLKIVAVNKNKDGGIDSVDAQLDLDNKDYKKTLKVTWLAATKSPKTVPVVAVHYDHIISKAVIGKDEDWKNFINYDSQHNATFVGEPAMIDLKKGAIVQIQRKGFYICDRPYAASSPHSGVESPLVLISVPDGHVKEMPTAVKKQTASDGQRQSASPAKDQKATANGDALKAEVDAQGELVRTLKAGGGSADDVKAAVAKLLALKAKYKEVTGVDYQAPAQGGAGGKKGKEAEKKPAEQSKQQNASSAANGDAVKAEVDAQGELVRTLKAGKASADDVKAAVAKLLALKAKYKEVTGVDYPAQAPAQGGGGKKGKEAEKKSAEQPKQQNAPSASNGDALKAEVDAQGELVRTLKAGKASADDVKAAVAKLLALKAKYKEVTGLDYQAQAPAQGGGGKKGKEAEKKPAEQSKQQQQSTMAPPATDNEASNGDALKTEIDAQGELVRKLKGSGGSEAETKAAIAKLLELKAKYKEVTGVDLAAAGGGGNKKGKGGGDKKAADKPKQAEKAAPQAAGGDAGKDGKKQTKLGVETKKSDNYSDWYSQVITKGEMIEYYDVSGCYVLRPWSYAIWEAIQAWFDKEIKKLGVKNAYFPMFVSQAALEREKTHIADFAPEVAWVTKSGETDLAEPIAIRPTSETVMYPSYAKWVQSHRDLPIKMNQWCNVVRWEFKHPTPFLRTREFLWQEGHTAFATPAEAEKEVFQILDLYSKIYTDLLAVPVIKGRKTEKEKFAGGDFTTTVEAYVPVNGRGIQGATSHHLGQNFSKMFDISFEDPESQGKTFAWQNSWGLSTRTIGAMVMIHGDDAGLVLPPRVAAVQVIIIACGITVQTTDKEREQLLGRCEDYQRQLAEAGVRAETDLRDNYSPGWKFNHWELKGVPIRLELGPRDMASKQFVVVRRDTAAKSTIAEADLVSGITKLLDQIHHDMYESVKKARDEHMAVTEDWAVFKNKLEQKFIIQAPFCGDGECEERIKKESAREDAGDPGAPAMGAKSLCIPLEQPKPLAAGQKCFHPACSKPAKFYTLFGRSY